MSVYRFILVLAAVVGIGLFTVWQHVEAVRLGYKVTQLESILARLEEANRQLSMEVENLKSPYELLRRAEEMGIKLENATPLRVEDQLPYEVINPEEDNTSVIPGDGLAVMDNNSTTTSPGGRSPE